MERFPRYLSAPFQILWFEADELFVMVFFFMTAIMFGNTNWMFALLALAGVFGVYGYSVLKRKHPRGFFGHLLYFAGLTDIKGYPSFFVDKFIE